MKKKNSCAPGVLEKRMPGAFVVRLKNAK